MTTPSEESLREAQVFCTEAFAHQPDRYGLERVAALLDENKALRAERDRLAAQNRALSDATFREAEMRRQLAEAHEALDAHAAWSIAEDGSLVQFSMATRQTLCTYAQWLTDRARGITSEPYKPTPLGIDVFSREVVARSEEECREIVKSVLATRAALPAREEG